METFSVKYVCYLLRYFASFSEHVPKQASPADLTEISRLVDVSGLREFAVLGVVLPLMTSLFRLHWQHLLQPL
jgi:hypothetical protein